MSEQHHSLALGVSFGAGALLAAQARVNGTLAQHLGSAVVAALVSFAVGTVAVLGYAAGTGAIGRARTSWTGAGITWWHCLGGLGGATLVAASAAAAPLIGVALLSVMVVAGQTTGALVVDRVGIGPSGRHHVTSRRLCGSLVAVAALALGAWGQHVRDLRPLVLGALVAAGFLVAGQQAVNGQLQRRTGEAGVASLISFAGGTTALLLLSVALRAGGGLPALHGGAPWWAYLGGLGGALYITLSALVVRTLGVLRLSLASIAGQLAGALVLDLAWPVAGHGVRPVTVAAVALTLVAVLIAAERPR